MRRIKVVQVDNVVAVVVIGQFTERSKEKPKQTRNYFRPTRLKLLQV